MKNGYPKPKKDSILNPKVALGRRGEDMAVAFFVAEGFDIIARNWRCRFGELDLILRRGQEIRFVEVKMRKSHAFGYPEASITRKKLAHLQAAMELWLRQQPRIPTKYQLDVLAISVLNSAKDPDLQWIQGV